jgi:hypothetical protein
MIPTKVVRLINGNNFRVGHMTSGDLVRGQKFKKFPGIVPELFKRFMNCSNLNPSRIVKTLTLLGLP